MPYPQQSMVAPIAWGTEHLDLENNCVAMQLKLTMSCQALLLAASSCRSFKTLAAHSTSIQAKVMINFNQKFCLFGAMALPNKRPKPLNKTAAVPGNSVYQPAFI